MGSPTTLRRELLWSFAVLFGGAILVAVAGLHLTMPVLETPGEATLLIVSLVVADLLILFIFGRALLRRTLFQPIDGLIRDAREIADGNSQHRVTQAETVELQALSDSMNAMAERLIHGQDLLSDNVRSLEDTNKELVLARDQVIRSARLASVGTLAAGLAHEVGNPLGAIMAYLDAARSRVGSDGEVGDVLDATMKEAKRIDRIIRSLLDYARPRRDIDGPADPLQVVRRVRSLLDAQGRFEDVNVEWDMPLELGSVLLDPHHLEQVLVNLLLNAVDALEEHPDPRLVVTLREIRDIEPREPARREGDPPGINYAHRRRVPHGEVLSPEQLLQEAEHVVVLRVQDNGPGLEPEVLEHLFDPFFTTKQPGKGTGLGLAVCARLVEEMGASIVARNGPDGGALFEVLMPGSLRGEEPGNLEDGLSEEEVQVHEHHFSGEEV